MADDVIKSFLVRIGYKQDEVALRKITEGIATATKAVLGFGVAIASTAAAVAWGVTRIASNLETLYFASIRTGSSASQLEAFEFAARRMGAQAGSGLAAVESLAAFFRNNPPGMAAKAIETWFPGVHANEHDPVKTMVEIGNAMQRMDYYQAKFRANAIGLSDEQVWYLRQPGLSNTYNEMLKALGPNFEKAVDDAHKFENALGFLMIRLEGFGSQVIDVLENKFGWSLNKLSAWLDKNGEQFANSLVNGLKKFLDKLQELEPKLEWLLNKLKDLDTATDGWSTIIIGLTVLFPGLVSGIVSVGVALAGLTIGAAARGIGMLGALLRIATPVGAGVGLGWGFDKLFPNNWLARAGDYIGNQIYNFTHQKESAMLALQAAGFTRANAAGIVANLNAESSLQANAIGDNGQAYGIAQWHEAGQKRFKQLFGFDIRGSSVEDQLKFLIADTRPGGANENVGRALRNADAATSGQIFSRLYERPAAGETEAIRRGQEAVTLNQTTHINVDGSAEPQVVAKRVADAQDQRNQRLAAAITREFASNVQ